MKANEMWQAFCQKKGIDEKTKHDEWAFCGGSKVGDELTELVLKGIKTATASCYDLYEQEGEPIPAADAYSVVLWDNGEAACVIQNYSVGVAPFLSVQHYHAYLEGEFDRSLEKWREAHKEIFTEECQENGLTFTDETKVVMEKFELVYPEMPWQEDLILIEQDERFREEILAYRQEFLDAGDSMDGTGGLRSAKSAEQWVTCSQQYADPCYVITNGWVHSTQLMCLRKSDQKIIGMIHIRHEFNDHLRKYAGHVGYSTRPSERKKGVAKWMLKKVLPYCASLGIKEAMVSCIDHNEGSRATILANGGIHIRNEYEPEEGVMLEIYHVKTE